MVTHITFIHAGDTLQNSDNALACQAICNAANLSVVIERDDIKPWKLSKGCVNPKGGFVMQTADGTVLLYWHQLAKWIESNGLIPL